MIRGLLLAVGLLLTAFGLLFLGQGLGWIRWPASSFMIGQQRWVDWGAILAALGLVLVMVGRRVRR